MMGLISDCYDSQSSNSLIKLAKERSMKNKILNLLSEVKVRVQ